MHRFAEKDITMAVHLKSCPNRLQSEGLHNMLFAPFENPKNYEPPPAINDDEENWDNEIKTKIKNNTKPMGIVSWLASQGFTNLTTTQCNILSIDALIFVLNKNHSSL